jgi:hypothetical protein
MLLLALRPLLERCRAPFLRLRGARLLVAPALPLALYALVLAPRFPATRDLVHDWHLHAVYFSFFAYGWWIAADAAFWAEAKRLRHVALAAALACFLFHASFREAVLTKNLYSWCAIVALLGYAHAHLNRPFRWLGWANESVYPWYVLHQSILLVLGFWLAPYALGPVLEPAAILAGTLLGCWLLTDLVVRRSRWVGPLFGAARLAPARP